MSEESVVIFLNLTYFLVLHVEGRFEIIKTNILQKTFKNSPLSCIITKRAKNIAAVMSLPASTLAQPTAATSHVIPHSLKCLHLALATFSLTFSSRGLRHGGKGARLPAGRAVGGAANVEMRHDFSQARQRLNDAEEQDTGKCLLPASSPS